MLLKEDRDGEIRDCAVSEDGDDNVSRASQTGKTHCGSSPREISFSGEFRERGRAG